MSSSQMFPNSVSLNVSNMNASLAFYRDKLGYKLNECWPSEGQPMWASLVLDGQVIMLGQALPPGECEKMHAMSPVAAKFWSAQAAAFAKGTHGAGVNLFIAVPDVDAYHAQLRQRGLEPVLPPTTQFYGLRDTVVVDPDGYVLTFYAPVKLESCQSCGMPLTNAAPGQMYCAYCVDEKGVLRPYEQVFQGTVHGYFMEHLKMPKEQAEKAAREHLAKMPAWCARG
ncbi:MAG: VOC family protein [Planctomycetes bacterium]|nr:VOC family protein [Planctomycetota bacterium]